jgi:hypothetical protein
VLRGEEEEGERGGVGGWGEERSRRGQGSRWRVEQEVIMNMRKEGEGREDRKEGQSDEHERQGEEGGDSIEGREEQIWGRGRLKGRGGERGRVDEQDGRQMVVGWREVAGWDEHGVCTLVQLRWVVKGVKAEGMVMILDDVSKESGWSGGEVICTRCPLGVLCREESTWTGCAHIDGWAWWV